MIDVYEKLVGYFGGTSATARAFRVAPQVVDNWRKRGIPKARALEAELLTKRHVTAREVLKA